MHKYVIGRILLYASGDMLMIIQQIKRVILTRYDRVKAGESSQGVVESVNDFFTVSIFLVHPVMQPTMTKVNGENVPSPACIGEISCMFCNTRSSLLVYHRFQSDGGANDSVYLVTEDKLLDFSNYKRRSSL